MKTLNLWVNSNNTRERDYHILNVWINEIKNQHYLMILLEQNYVNVLARAPILLSAHKDRRSAG